MGKYVWMDLRCVGAAIRGGFAWREDGFVMREDDWEVTRHLLPASLQPIRAEQIGWRWWFCRSKYGITLLGENYTIFRYGIALGGDSDARHVTSQLGMCVGLQCLCRLYGRVPLLFYLGEVYLA